MCLSYFRCSKGFTMVEMAVVLAIISIIVGIAVPSFSSWIKKQRGDAAVFEIASVFEKAKFLAIKRGVDIKFSIDVEGDGVKDNGYCLFIDGNSTAPNTQNKVTADDEIISIKRFEHSEFDMGNSTEFIRFNNGGSVLPCGSVAVKMPSGSITKVSVSILGKVNVIN